MKNLVMSLGAVVVLYCATAAQAATYYVSDCAVGTGAPCVRGNDAQDGLSPATAWRTTAKIEQVFPSLNGGDTILFAKGGEWADSGMTLQNLKSTAASPITLDSYTPAWGGTAKPKLISTAARSGIAFSDTDGNWRPDGGYVVRNLRLAGAGSGIAVTIAGETADVTLENLNIESFNVGFFCRYDTYRVKLLNSTIKDNRVVGVSGSCKDLLIQNNVLDNNGSAGADGKSIFIGTWDAPMQNVSIRDNVITRNAEVGGACQAPVVVVQGVISNLQIDNNLIRQTAGTSTTACRGIVLGSPRPDNYFAEKYADVDIRANTVVNVGGVGIGCSSCVDSTVANNVVIQESGPQLIAIGVPEVARGSGDAPAERNSIQNNSIYFGAPAPYSYGIGLVNGSSNIGPDAVVVSNLIYFAPSQQTQRACFDPDSSMGANYKAYRNNLCHIAGENPTPNNYYSTHWGRLDRAQQAGIDLGGTTADPQLVAVPSSANEWSMALKSTSPAINAGDPQHSAPDAFNQAAGCGVRDIGAYEFDSTGGPQWVRIANEYGSYFVSGTRTTRFGKAPSSWVEKVVTNSGYCMVDFYGSNPAGSGKWCEVKNDWTAPLWVDIAKEYASYTVDGTQNVRFGNSAGWVSKPVTGKGYCTTTYYGADPAPGAKRCQIMVQPYGSCATP
jgi:hypothetical protein